MLPSFDRLILDYLKGIYTKYAMLLDLYNANLEKQIDSEARVIFQGDTYNAWVAAQKGVLVYDKLREKGKAHPHIKNKKVLWFSLLKQNESDMAFTLYSGKK